MKLKFSKYVLSTILVLSLVQAFAKSSDCVVKLFNNTTTMEADYTQNVYGKKGKLIYNNNGHFMYKYPNLIRWQNTDNNKSLTINDGEYVWQYEPELEQVIKAKLNGNSIASNPYNVLADSANLSKHFYVTRKTSGKNIKKFMLKEKSKKGKRIWLTFDRDDLVKISFYDNLHNLTEINFTKIERNKTISDKWFTFVPEENIDVIEQ